MGAKRALFPFVSLSPTHPFASKNLFQRYLGVESCDGRARVSGLSFWPLPPIGRRTGLLPKDRNRVED